MKKTDTRQKSRDILILLSQNWTMQRIGESMSLTKQRISQILTSNDREVWHRLKRLQKIRDEQIAVAEKAKKALERKLYQWSSKPEGHFWENVDVGDSVGCWEWQLCTIKTGYGHLSWGDSTNYAHRVAWWLRNGEIPEGMEVCHRCDNPPCCNPAHLFVATHHENVLDAMIKGRYNCKLTPNQVRSIRKRYSPYGTNGISGKELAREYDVARGTISSIVNNRTRQFVKD